MMVDIQQRLTTLMEEQQIDQSTLARRVGCTPAAINQILTGRTVRSRFTPDIAEELGVSIEYLTGRSNEREPQFQGVSRYLSRDERNWIEWLRASAPKDRLALLQIAKTVATSAPSPSVHSDQLEYKAG